MSGSAKICSTSSAERIALGSDLGCFGNSSLRSRIERQVVHLHEIAEELVDFLQVTRLGRPSQWLAIALAIAIQMALERFQHRLGDQRRTSKVSVQAPQREVADVHHSQDASCSTE